LWSHSGHRASKIPYKALGKVAAYVSSLNASSTQQSDDTASSASGNPAERVKVKATDGQTYKIIRQTWPKPKKAISAFNLLCPTK